MIASNSLYYLTMHDLQSTLSYPGPIITQFHISAPNLYDLMTALLPTTYAILSNMQIYTRPTILQPIYSKKNPHSHYTYMYVYYQHPSMKCYIAMLQLHTQDPLHTQKIYKKLHRQMRLTPPTYINYCTRY